MTEAQLRVLNTLVLSLLLGVFFNFSLILILLVALNLVFRHRKFLAMTNILVVIIGLSPLSGVRFFDGDWAQRILFAPLSAGLFALVVLYFWATLSWSRIRCSFVLLVVSFLGFSAIVIWFPDFSALTNLAFFWFSHIWFMLAWSRSLQSGKDLNWVNFGIALQPICTFNPAPILDSWTGEVLPQSTEGRDLQRRTLNLLFVTFGVCLFRDFLAQFADENILIKLAVFPETGVGNGLFATRASKVSTQEWWFVSVGVFLYSTSRIFTAVLPAVAFMRIYGLDLKSPVHNLLRSRSFYQFLENSNHYYCKLLVDQFVLPIMHLVAKFKSPKIRLYFSFFWGIVLCGFAYHFTKPNFFSFSAGLLTNFYWIVQVLFYWVLIGIAVVLSFVLERGNSAAANRATLFLKNLIYILIASMIYIFIREFEMKDYNFWGHWNLFLKLWGLD